MRRQQAFRRRRLLADRDGMACVARSSQLRGATALNRKRIFEFAAQQKLPAIYEYDFLVRDGGLMSCGPDMTDVYDRAADLADRILKGASPADLPFEQPTRFRLVINKKTLETLGLTIPAATLMRADEVID